MYRTECRQPGETTFLRSEVSHTWSCCIWRWGGEGASGRRGACLLAEPRGAMDAITGALQACAHVHGHFSSVAENRGTPCCCPTLAGEKPDRQKCTTDSDPVLHRCIENGNHPAMVLRAYHMAPSGQAELGRHHTRPRTHSRAVHSHTAAAHSRTAAVRMVRPTLGRRHLRQTTSHWSCKG